MNIPLQKAKEGKAETLDALPPEPDPADISMQRYASIPCATELSEVLAERERSLGSIAKRARQWPGTPHPNASAWARVGRDLIGTAEALGPLGWMTRLVEYTGHVARFAALGHPGRDRLRRELLHLAAMALEWVQALDEGGAK